MRVDFNAVSFLLFAFQESFFLSETVKYLYLLFDRDNPVNRYEIPNYLSLNYSTALRIHITLTRFRIPLLTLMRIRILLFTLMRILIMLLIKVM
jgi:hypothetical protein